MTDINKTVQFEYYREQSREMACEIVELQSMRRGLIAECQSLSIELENVKTERDKKIIELERTLDKSTNDVVRLTAWLDEVLKALNVHPFASINHVVDRVHATVNRVNELETQQTYSEIKLNEQLDLLRKTIDTEQMTHDCLTAALEKRIAELEARPVLTVERFTEAYIKAKHGDHMWPVDEAARAGLMAAFRSTFAKLGPVTLPSQDRAEELARAFMNERAARGKFMTWAELTDADRAKMTDAARAALASLGAPPTSPTVAPPEVFAGVSDDELCRIYGDAFNPSAMDPRADAIRAVLARLKTTLVAPVDPEAVARAYHDDMESPVPEWRRAADYDINSPVEHDHEQARLRAASAMRTALIAAGVPVTPERGK